MAKLFKDMAADEQAAFIERNRFAVADSQWPDVAVDIVSDFRERIRVFGLDVDAQDVRYSGFGSQGDGPSFTAAPRDVNVEKLVGALGVTFRHETLKRLFVETAIIEIPRLSARYCHEKTVEVSCSAGGFHGSRAHGCWRLERYLDKKAQEVAEKLESLKDDLCGELYAQLEDEYFAMTEDEYLREFFTENGADELITDAEICAAFGGVQFCEDDFFAA